MAIGRMRLRTYGSRATAERIRAAVQDLCQSDCDGLALLVPRRWELLQELARVGAFRFETGSEEGRVGTFDGYPAYDLGDDAVDWAAVVVPRHALAVSQADNPIHSTVLLVDEALATQLAADGDDAPGDPSESAAERLQLQVRLEIKASVGVAVRPGGVRRIRISWDEPIQVRLEEL